MNGAESLVRTLVAGGVEVCFANPGTSEMHFVAALDRVEGMRCVLGLFEGVVTGAADGYARMADKPAATLLHLGPGMANGLANIHNARRALTPMLNIVGEHATYHLEHDAPLTSDIEGAARPFSDWLRTSRDAKGVAADGAAAVAAALAPPGRIATLILPADTAWNEGGPVAPLPALAPRPRVAPEAIAEAARLLRSGEPCGLMIAGAALRERPLALAGRIAASAGARLLAPLQNGRIERGAGRVAIDRVPYPVDPALKFLAGLKHLLVLGAKPPVAFFAYPGKPSVLTPPDCAIHRIAGPGDDLVQALEDLADELGAAGAPPVQRLELPQAPPDGKLTAPAIAAIVAARLPENTVIVDESVTEGRAFYGTLRGARPHDWLNVTGGAIGIGIPLATGAAIACSDRKILNLEADGSAMYTLQGLWTQAREGLDVTTVILNNRAYLTLKGELANVGAQNPGRKATDMLSLDRPDIDFAALARGMGVEAGRATTVAEFGREFAAALKSGGPYLIDAVI
jgi:acetolactate synthase I/II/III large subunit